MNNRTGVTEGVPHGAFHSGRIPPVTTQNPNPGAGVQPGTATQGLRSPTKHNQAACDKDPQSLPPLTGRAVQALADRQDSPVEPGLELTGFTTLPPGLETQPPIGYRLTGEHEPVELLLWRRDSERSLTQPSLIRIKADEMTHGYKSFVYCLEQLIRTRQQTADARPESGKDISDPEAVLTALWFEHLWYACQASNMAELQQLDARVAHCTKEHTSRLLPHLAFVEKHQATLRQILTAHCQAHSIDEAGRHSFSITIESGSGQRSIDLLRGYDEESGLCLEDNTYLVYFATQKRPDIRQEIEKRTGERLPGAFWGIDILESAPENPATD